MQRADEHAQRVLACVPEWIWDGETLPVPVEEIADSVFGLLVRDVEDMSAAPGAPALASGQSLSGLLLASRGEIWVNAQEARTWPTRRRFTIGHELGHWELHRDGQQSLFCRRTAVDEQPPPQPSVVDIEEEASRFAAALLMPAWLMVREHARVGGDLDRLITTFRTSGVAMTRRVADLFGA
ncbi:MAG TPA: ImmA/IrrE family metallo-endopeptidase [Solirubrobacteraceae bacterium]|nr:ImmA/IrrE family metallo-endopeptidase [Solirubrobacteraceae bacterium]